MISLYSVTLHLYCLLFSVCLHPMHLSVTEIEMDDQDKRLEIMMRVFVDDLEVTLRKEFGNPDLDVIRPKGLTIDQMMETYLRTHFRIALDNKPQSLVYLGHELEGEAFIFYIEVSPVKKWKTIAVKNDIIMDTYHDQSNLVHVTVRDAVKSLRLTRIAPEASLVFGE